MGSVQITNFFFVSFSLRASSLFSDLNLRLSLIGFNDFFSYSTHDMKEKSEFKRVGQSPDIPPPERQVRILILDDHPIVRQGIRHLIEGQDDMMVIGEASNYHEAIELVNQNPHVVIVDLSLSNLSGLDFIKSLKAHFPQVHSLVLSMYDEQLYAERALRAGARGYVMKHEAATALMTAIRRVMEGKLYLSDRVETDMLSKFVAVSRPSFKSRVEFLSDRELEIFQLIGQGLNTNRIASRLHVSGKTVESHRTHIKEKLHFETMSELVHYAVQWAQSDALLKSHSE